MPAGLPSRWAFTGGGLRSPVHDEVGIEVVGAAAGHVSLEVRPYLHNSFGAVQGGVIGMLAEAAGAEALGAARGGDGSDVVVTDLQIAYLALGRVDRQLRLDRDPAGAVAVRDLEALDPVLLDLSNRRATQKERFGGELFPNVIETQSGLSFAEFFQNERDTSRKGIVVIRLSKGDAS